MQVYFIFNQIKSSKMYPFSTDILLFLRNLAELSIWVMITLSLQGRMRGLVINVMAIVYSLHICIAALLNFRGNLLTFKGMTKIIVSLVGTLSMIVYIVSIADQLWTSFTTVILGLLFYNQFIVSIMDTFSSFTQMIYKLRFGRNLAKLDYLLLYWSYIEHEMKRPNLVLSFIVFLLVHLFVSSLVIMKNFIENFFKQRSYQIGPYRPLDAFQEGHSTLGDVNSILF